MNVTIATPMFDILEAVHHVWDEAKAKHARHYRPHTAVNVSPIPQKALRMTQLVAASNHPSRIGRIRLVTFRTLDDPGVVIQCGYGYHSIPLGYEFIVAIDSKVTVRSLDVRWQYPFLKHRGGVLVQGSPGSTNDS